MDEVLDEREQRLNDVLGAYLEAEDAGWAPERGALLSRYPDLAGDLQAFFVAQSHVAALAYPCPASAQRQGKDADVTPTAGEGTSVRTGPHSTAVSGYESFQMIKEGGMGVVYKAWQKGAERWVALKKIKAGRFASQTEVRRFLDEAQAAANLKHPNIVPIYQVGEENGEPFFSMEFFAHGTLQDHLARFQNDQRAAAGLLAKVARAVHHAHQYGILHRDLKPANILLDAQEQPYVADFGLAKRLRPAPSEPVASTSAPTDPKAPTAREPGTDVAPGRDLDDVSYLAPEQATKTQPLDQTQDRTADGSPRAPTRAGTFLGTKGYIPPEHAELSMDATSTAADVYSLGAILYKLLTGKTLFDATTLADAVRQVKECQPEPPRALNPQADERLTAICLKCLRKNPTERYTSAQALAEDLERWLAREPPLAWPMPRRLRAWRSVRRNLLVVLAATLTGFAAAAIFFVFYYFNPERVPRRLEREAREKRVTLIGTTGHPRWARWTYGEGLAMIVPDADKPFSYATLDKGRLELLRKAPPKYRFRAEVRHDEAFPAGGSLAGIYFGYTERADDDGAKRYWCDLTFADVGALARRPDPKAKRGTPPASGKLDLTLDRYAPPQHSVLATETFLYFPSTAGANAAGAKEVPNWRRLQVDVNADKVQVSWEGLPLKDLSRAYLKKLGEEGLKIGNTVVFPQFPFDPETALGLYVQSGKASFRNVTIEPLE